MYRYITIVLENITEEDAESIAYDLSYGEHDNIFGSSAGQTAHVVKESQPPITLTTVPK